MRRTALLALTLTVAAAGLTGCGGRTHDKLISEGIADFQVGKLDDAKAKLEAGLAAKPHHADGLFYMGRLHHVRGELGRAVFYYQCCLDAAPGHPGAKKYLAQARRQLGPEAETLRLVPDPVQK